jgi:chemotaxis protein CheZ
MMKVAGVSEAQDELTEMVRAAVRAEIAGAVEDLRRFVDRRIAELSAEVHGATQLLDFSEANLSGQLSRIQQEIGRVVAAPALATRTSGLELEAVVQTTEHAANQIMEAAEGIAAWIEEGREDPAAAAAITQRLNAIFEACTFQDLTGQRIRRAIEHLEHVEQMLSGLAPEGVPTPIAQDATAEPPGGADLGQNDVDSLFGATETPSADAGLGQNDVDRMFG